MSELKKMNDALEMRLGEVVDLARKTWWKCADVERDIEWTSEEERNVALLGAFTEIRQLCEFYKPKDDAAEAELHEAATEEPTTVGCPSLVPTRVAVHDEPTPPEEKRHGHYLKFHGMTMRAFGGKGLQTTIIGKRATDAGDRIYEIKVERADDSVGCSARATENGKELFALYTDLSFRNANHLAVSCLHTLLHVRKSENRRRRASHKRAKAAKAAALKESAAE